jgi:glycopeptide antibiotics resistance protein
LKKSLFISLLLSIGLFLILSPIIIKLVTYLHPIVLAVVFFCILICFFFLVLWIRKQTIRIPYNLFLGVLGLYTIALFILLFFRPNDQSYQSWNMIPFSTISFYFSGKVNWLISFYNLTANIGLFIPYGIFLMIKTQGSALKLIFIPMIAIAIIEILQFFTHRGSMDFDDLILNLLGVFIGYLFFPSFKRIVKLKNKKKDIYA